jgi:ABC-type microcin C transport system permease subunit YejB
MPSDQHDTHKATHTRNYGIVYARHVSCTKEVFVQLEVSISFAVFETMVVYVIVHSLRLEASVHRGKKCMMALANLTRRSTR